jgi:hypothetical protein
MAKKAVRGDTDTSNLFTVNPFLYQLFKFESIAQDTCFVFQMHLGGVESQPPSFWEPSDSTREHLFDAPRSQRRPSAIRLKALTSPPCPGSQDYPTVPGYPVAAAVMSPTSHAAIPIQGLLLVYGDCMVGIPRYWVST